MAAVKARRWLDGQDAARAAEVLREADAGHDGAATELSARYGLDDLTEQQMRTLCDLFGIEI